MVVAKKLYLWVCLVVVVLSLATPLSLARQFHGFYSSKFDFGMLPKNTPIPPSGPNEGTNTPPPPPEFYDSNNFNFGVLPKGPLNPPPGPNAAGDLFSPPPPGSEAD